MVALGLNAGFVDGFSCPIRAVALEIPPFMLMTMD
jgi:hypothetical protein